MKRLPPKSTNESIRWLAARAWLPALRTRARKPTFTGNRLLVNAPCNKFSLIHQCAFFCLSSLYMMVKNFVCRIGEDADVFMSFFDGKDVVPIRYLRLNYCSVLLNRCVFYCWLFLFQIDVIDSGNFSDIFGPSVRYPLPVLYVNNIMLHVLEEVPKALFGAVVFSSSVILRLCNVCFLSIVSRV